MIKTVAKKEEKVLHAEIKWSEFIYRKKNVASSIDKNELLGAHWLIVFVFFFALDS